MGLHPNNACLNNPTAKHVFSLFSRTKTEVAAYRLALSFILRSVTDNPNAFAATNAPTIN
ncbi:MAG TPA: hypothetical protein VGB84_08095 [Arachidicoccus sp.]